MMDAPDTSLHTGRRSASFGAHALGLFQVTHPLPCMLYGLAVAIFSLLAAGAHHHLPDGAMLARAVIGVTCGQFAIGALNDYCDRASDALHQPNKPLARGVIWPWEALALVALFTGVNIVLMATLGPFAFALGLMIEGLGVAYDLWFKGTPVSGLLYAINFPLFPLLAWALFGNWQPFLLWLLPIGALLGIAMNIANSLPDLEGDLANGVRGLPHLLGFRRGLLVAWGLPAISVALIWALHLMQLAPAHLPALWIATLAGLLSVALAMLLYLRKPLPATLKVTFYVQAVGVVGLAVGWLAAVAL